MTATAPADTLIAAADEMSAANRRFLAMCDLAVATSGHLDRRATLAAVAREAARLLAVEAAYVATPDGASIAAAGHPRPVPDPHRLAAATPRDARPTVRPAAELGLSGGTALIVPLVDAGGVIGVLALVDPVRGPFDVTDLWVASATAAHTVAALRTVRLHERALETARLETEYEVAGEVQRRLLPASPVDLAGLDVAIRSEAALQVGGDFLDHQVTADGHLHLALGDVSGKGVSAAMLAAVTHLALQRWAHDLPSGNPAGVLAAVNQETYEPLDDVGMLVTAFVASVDPDTGSVVYANGGQAPVVHVPATGGPRLLPPTTVPLGVLAAAPAREAEITLEPGDLLVIASDGIIEQRDPSGELFGLARLNGVLEHLPTDLPADEAADALLATVAAWADGVPADDDVSLIVLRVEVDRCDA